MKPAPDWTHIRAACLRDALSLGLSHADADDVAQEACIRTLLGSHVRDPLRHAKGAVANLAADVLEVRRRSGLTTGAGISWARTGVDVACLSVRPDQVEHVAACEVRFALLVTGVEIEPAKVEHRMTVKRRRDAVRAVLADEVA